LYGNVPDVRPFLHRATMLVVPLRVGGGSRLKVLEALACGTPVASTRVGAEGLALASGRHLEVSDDVDALAGCIVRLLRDPERARRQAEAGRTQVLHCYDWDGLARRLEQLWLRCAGAAPALAPNLRGMAP
jgi:glycosyltransferase involved in cell wall biosynthesis